MRSARARARDIRAVEAAAALGWGGLLTSPQPAPRVLLSPRFRSFQFHQPPPVLRGEKCDGLYDAQLDALSLATVLCLSPPREAVVRHLGWIGV